MHKYLKFFVNGSIFNNLATLCVFANTAILALDGMFTDPKTNEDLEYVNDIFTFIFIGEMIIKLIALSPIGNNILFYI